MAGHRGEVADPGAGDAGGARANAAAGEAAPAGLWSQGTDQLAMDGPPRHAGGAEKTGVAALGAAGLHPGAVAGVGRGWGDVCCVATSKQVIWVELGQDPLGSLPFGRMFG